MLLLTHNISFFFVILKVPALSPPSLATNECEFGWVDKKSSTGNFRNNSHENDLQGIYCDAIKIQIAISSSVLFKKKKI